MASMALIPSLVAALTAAAGAAAAAHLAVRPDPFSAPSATVIAVGLVVYTLIAVTGIALVRGRWARRLGIVVVVADLAVIAVGALDVLGWIALGSGLAALGGLVSRWLDGWFRLRPSATGPDPIAVVLLLGLGALAPAVGFASPAGLTTGHGILGAAGLLLAWAYANAHLWSLWAARVALPMVAVPAVVSSPWPGAIALGASTAALVWLAWSKEALLAVQPLMATLPGPRHGRPRPDRGEIP
jgi:hypothetical protein